MNKEKIFRLATIGALSLTSCQNPSTESNTKILVEPQFIESIQDDPYTLIIRGERGMTAAATSCGIVEGKPLSASRTLVRTLVENCASLIVTQSSPRADRRFGKEE